MCLVATIYAAKAGRFIRSGNGGPDPTWVLGCLCEFFVFEVARLQQANKSISEDRVTAAGGSKTHCRHDPVPA